MHNRGYSWLCDAASSIVFQVADMQEKQSDCTYSAKCCFHDVRGRHDKTTTSLTFHYPGNTFFCYICMEKGDVIDFYAKKHGLTNKEAIRELANTYEIDRTKGLKQAILNIKSIWSDFLSPYMMIHGTRGEPCCWKDVLQKSTWVFYYPIGMTVAFGGMIYGMAMIVWIMSIIVGILAMTVGFGQWWGFSDFSTVWLYIKETIMEQVSYIPSTALVLGIACVSLYILAIAFHACFYLYCRTSWEPDHRKYVSPSPPHLKL